MIIKTVKHKPTTIIFLCLGLFFLTVTSALAQDTENPASIPGRIQGTGTFFEIKDSEYLNISLQSSEEITITLESVPKTISLIIEASSVSVSTILTFGNLEPNTTYYKFEDSYKNEVGFTTDENGKYTFTDNNIFGNEIGMVFEECPYDNKVYHNNFIDNLSQVSIEFEVTEDFIFDNGYPSGGNYWSDYDTAGEGCVDTNSDGFCDASYSFTGGQDRYPFMKESGWEIPPVPTYNIAVIFAEPADVFHDSAPKSYQPCKLLPEKTYPNGHSKEYYQDLAYCVAGYHKENSFGTFDLDFDIIDDNGNWFKTIKKEGDYLGKELEFVIDTINLATSAGIDLSDKDIVIVLHSGEAAKKKEDIGKKLITKTWGLVSQPLGYPPYKIIVAEDDLVGTWAHEIGHIIGALLTPENTIIPDLSEMDLVTKWPEILDPVKAGKWDLMAEGSWNDGGNDPPHMSSYTKEFLKWLNYDIHPKSAYGEYWINSLDTSKLDDSIFRYNLSEDTNDESPEYYILEARNRNLKIWDSSLPKEKVLVLYRVDTYNFPEYGYDEEGYMWNKYRSIVIPGGIREYFVNDGVLSPTGETYRDFDSLVKFTALSDRTINDSYEIQTKIEEITYDSFPDVFWGVILKPSSLFRQKIKEIFPLNPLSVSGFRGGENNSRMLLATVCVINPQTGKEECSWIPRPLTEKEMLQKIFKILIPVFLLIFLLIWLNKKIIPRLESERKRKIIKILIRIFLIISGVAFVGLLILLMGMIVFASEETIGNLDINNSRKVAAPLLQPLIYSDLDLHLYTEDGKHIGMNYETGEYEIQIEGAIVSGDNQDSPEWIFIPPIDTNYHFVVSSYDNQKFLEENPDIAQEIEDTIDSYEVYARYIDPETAIYTSTITSEQINLGQEIEHQISGTHDITIEPGSLILNISDIIEDVKTSYELGWTTKKGVKNILIAKLKAAQKLQEQKEKQLKHFNKLIEKAKNPKAKQSLEKAKEKYKEAMNKAITKILKSFIKEVEIYTKKGWITKQASELLINDANYIIEHL